MDGVVFKLGPEKYWYVQADGDFESWLLAHTAGYDVQISDPNSRVLQIQEPLSIEVMKAATNGQIDESMSYYQSGFLILVGKSSMFHGPDSLMSWDLKFIVMELILIIWLFGIISMSSGMNHLVWNSHQPEQ